ncbi:MAG TPA: metallophosphoesterase [Dysgonamonadaceae bacterium]|nr:metallophosphoesterase [Dysgonamonadaceae bacterium]HRS40605.1 metallophosphoesterase [Dysgonamonadaceae bacterium]HRU13350.1 metallophosphoesterase [Dysgonamonadaceae bacterium]
MAVMSDIHFLGTDLAQSGEALTKYENATGRNVNELHAVLDETLKQIEAASVNALLICGDLTNHGERGSHLELIRKLTSLKQKGIRIYVIPGNHDVDIPDAKAYVGDESSPTQTVSAKEFAELYAPFGYSGAIRRDSASLSYLSALTDSLWLLSLDSNRYNEHTATSISGGRLLPQTVQWAMDILSEARSKNITVLGMMHHGLVEHMPYQATFFPNYLVEDWKKLAAEFADAGMSVVFTGHFHANDISSLTSANGNTIYDVETGSLSQYPLPYRLIEIDGNTLKIDSHFIQSVEGVPNLQEKYQEKMEKYAKASAEAQLSRLKIPLAEETRQALADLLSRINILHVAGDEKVDAETAEAIQKLAESVGDENFDAKSFQLDFPPADNHLTLSLKRE